MRVRVRVRVSANVRFLCDSKARKVLVRQAGCISRDIFLFWTTAEHVDHSRGISISGVEFEALCVGRMWVRGVVKSSRNSRFEIGAKNDAPARGLDRKKAL